MKKTTSHLDQYFVTPNPIRSADLPDRNQWLEAQAINFVGTPGNSKYYRVILELLWPEGHGIPGPMVTEGEIRDAINHFRAQQYLSEKHDWELSGRRGKEPLSPPPYQDPFRRLRELQGEEGFLGITKEGKRAQLHSLEVSPKRTPRVKLSAEDWAEVLRRYSGRCANCKRKPPEITLDQDHKVPRLRGGDNDLDNWQPLCTECNNFKSTACRGCDLDCAKCPWAFPELYSPPRIKTHLWEKIQKLAHTSGREANELLNEILEAV